MGQVYAVGGGKGGVGKTTTTANLAAAFVAAGYDAIAVDADLAMANLGPMMGVDPDAGATIHDVLAGEAALEDAIRTTEYGVDVLPGDRSLEGFAAADPADLRGVVDALREGDYDVVVIDTSAGLPHEVAVPLGLADAVVLTTTPDPVAVRDVATTGDLASEVEGNVAGLVVTRARDDERTERVLEELGGDVLAVVPDDPALTTETVAEPGSEVARAYNALAASLLGVEHLPEPGGTYAHATPDPPTLPEGLTPAIVPADDGTPPLPSEASIGVAEDPESGGEAESEDRESVTAADGEGESGAKRDASENDEETSPGALGRLRRIFE